MVALKIRQAYKGAEPVLMFRSSILVTLLALGGTAATVVNQLLLAHYFGAGAAMDAYLIAISQPSTVCGLIAGMLSYQLVPALMRAETRMGSADPLLGTLTWGLTGGSALIALLFVLNAEGLVRSTYANLPPEQIISVIKLTRISWLWLPLAVTSAIYTAGLHIRYKFAAATLLASSPIVGTALGCLLGHTRYGIFAVAFGQLAGYGGMLAGLRLQLGHLRTGLDLAGICEVGAQLPLALLALLVFVITPLSDAIWASRIGPSAVSHLGYTQRLLVGLASLAVVGATTVMFPRLAKQGAEGAVGDVRKNLARGLRVIVVCICPIAGLLATMALPSLQVLFQRGSFVLGDARAMAAVLPSMLAGMIAMCCMGIIFKAFFALGKLRQAALISVGGSLLYFCLSGILGTKIGLPGIGIAYAISWWLVLGASLFCIWERVPPLVSAEVVSFVLLLLVATIAAVAVARVGCLFLPLPESNHQLVRLVVLSGASGLALAVYLLVSYFTGMPEIRFIFQRGANYAKSQL